jgi:hypothetical protein
VAGTSPFEEEIVGLLAARRGHFLLESGHPRDADGA